MFTPSLQVAIDVIDLDKASTIACAAVEGGADILEVGTPVLAKYGVEAITRISRCCPMVPVYADPKTIDFAEMEVAECFKAGAAIVSVHLCANNSNIRAAIEIAYQHDGTIAISSLGYPISALRDRAIELQSYGVQRIVAHGMGDELSEAFSDTLQRAECLAGIVGIELTLAGGITPSRLCEVMKFTPQTIIVGRAITASSNVKDATADFKRKLRSLAS